MQGKFFQSPRQRRWPCSGGTPDRSIPKEIYLAMKAAINFLPGSEGLEIKLRAEHLTSGITAIPSKLPPQFLTIRSSNLPCGSGKMRDNSNGADIIQNSDVRRHSLFVKTEFRDTAMELYRVMTYDR
ncbi:hypothetical protein KM043_002309 [Ampulex compressa]|nr:hypothetical protein KM043_002309 [Ampulex compressa]